MKQRQRIMSSNNNNMCNEGLRMLLLLDAITLCLGFILHLVSHAFILAFVEYCTLVTIVCIVVRWIMLRPSPHRECTDSLMS